MDNDIMRDIKNLYIDCPDCKYMDDDQYTCTTCWCQGGNGRINVINWLNERKYLTNKIYDK